MKTFYQQYWTLFGFIYNLTAHTIHATYIAILESQRKRAANRIR